MAERSKRTTTTETPEQTSGRPAERVEILALIRQRLTGTSPFARGALQRLIAMIEKR